MKILEKLNLMKQIEKDNKQHVEDWKRKNMKIWVADYAYIDRDGIKRNSADDGSDRNEFTIQIEALDIQSALDEAKRTLLEKAAEEGWQEVKIIDVGICNENVW